MKKSYLALHLAVMLAGFTGVFGKLITLNEGLLVWYRLFFSFICLYFLLKLFRINPRIPFKEKLAIGKAGMFITASWVFFYASIKYSNISIGVVCYCLASFFIAVFNPLINKKRIVFTELLFSGITLLGISLIFHFDTSYQVGIILGVISSVFAALYTIFNARLVRKYDSRILNYYQMMGGSIGLGLVMPIYLWYFPVASVLPGWSNGIYLILLSLFCTVGLYVLFSEALKQIPAFTVTLSFNLEPIYAIAMAFLFFNEGKEVNGAFYIGCAFVMLSVLLQSLTEYRDRKRRSPGMI